MPFFVDTAWFGSSTQLYTGDPAYLATARERSTVASRAHTSHLRSDGRRR